MRVGQRAADMERLDRGDAEVADFVVALAAVQLYDIETDDVVNLTDVIDRGVLKNADDFRWIRHLAQPRCNRSRSLRLDMPRRRRHKNESEKIGSGLGAKQRVGLVGDAADFNFGHDPNTSRRTAAARSFCRSNDSPTRNASKPAARRRSISARVLIPLSATRRTPIGICRASRSDAPRSTLKSRRFRLLTPMMRAPPSIARSTSFSSCTSTSVSHEYASRQRMESRICFASSSDASSRIALAPAATPRMSCDSSMMKSFIRTGSCSAARPIHPRDPRKNSGSVTMEMAAAPP